MRLRRMVVVVATAALVLAGGGAVAQAENIGNEGCTPGYWKTHTDNWEEYRPTRTVGSVWVLPPELSQYSGWTFEQALGGGGGPGVAGAAQILLRASVAAYLNAAHEGLGYPYRRFNQPFNLEQQINAALASLDRGTMLSLATTLDTANNLGCPLN